jgi:hypothetical protein
VRKYLFQRFLPNCDTDNIQLDGAVFNGSCDAHKVSVSTLDEKIDTEDDLRNFLSQYSSKDIIVLIYDRPTYNNPILCDYANKTLRSYLYWVQHFGYRCYWEQSQTA